jgi:hypothetical protein
MPGFNRNVLETKTDATPSAFDVAGISQAYTVLENSTDATPSAVVTILNCRWQCRAKYKSS